MGEAEQLVVKGEIRSMKILRANRTGALGITVYIPKVVVGPTGYVRRYVIRDEKGRYIAVIIPEEPSGGEGGDEGPRVGREEH